MTHTILLKSKSYLTVTTIISVGVLSGCEFYSPVLAALLFAPVVKLLINNVTNKHHSVFNRFIFK